MARLLRKQDIRAQTKRRFVVTTDSKHGFPVAENLLDRQFDVAEPNRVWVSNITYIPTAEGWLYLVTILDLYSAKDGPLEATKLYNENGEQVYT